MTKNTMMMKRIQIVEEAVQTSVCFWKNVERMQTVWKVCIAQEISVLTAVSLGWLCLKVSRLEASVHCGCVHRWSHCCDCGCCDFWWNDIPKSIYREFIVLL